MIANHLTRRRIVALTANTTLTRGADSQGGQQLGATYTNLGATGSVTLTLPVDMEPGDFIEVEIAVAQAMVITGGANAVFTYVATAYTAGDSLRNSGTLGNRCEVLCTGLNLYSVRKVEGSAWSVS